MLLYAHNQACIVDSLLELMIRLLHCQVALNAVLALRALLCARSEYFAAMLHGSFAEGQAAEATQVTLEDIDPSVLSTALEWLYTDHIDPDTPFEFLVQVLSLPSHCRHCLPLSLLVMPIQHWMLCNDS